MYFAYYSVLIFRLEYQIQMVLIPMIVYRILCVVNL